MEECTEGSCGVRVCLYKIHLLRGSSTLKEFSWYSIRISHHAFYLVIHFMFEKYNLYTQMSVENYTWAHYRLLETNFSLNVGDFPFSFLVFFFLFCMSIQVTYFFFQSIFRDIKRAFKASLAHKLDKLGVTNDGGPQHG